MSRDLYVISDDVNVSLDAKNYLGDDFTTAFNPAFLYLGLHKPFSDLYFELKTAATVGNFSFEYWNGSSFVDLNADDHTKNLTRSGFINWKRDKTNWAKSTIEGLELFWVRVSCDVASTVEFTGINIVFADDNDLKAINRKIDRLLAQGDSSFISYHVAARDEIIQMLRNSGETVKALTENSNQNLNQWDLLDISELRNAAKYLALHFIYMDASDSSEDKFYQRARDFKSSFAAAYDLYYQSIDSNNDGKVDLNESTAPRFQTFSKV